MGSSFFDLEGFDVTGEAAALTLLDLAVDFDHC